MYKIDKPQGCIYSTEKYDLLKNNFKCSIIYENIESLCFTPETNAVF